MYTSCIAAKYKVDQKNLLAVLDFLGILVDQEDPTSSQQSQHNCVTIKSRTTHLASCRHWRVATNPHSFQSRTSRFTHISLEEKYMTNFMRNQIFIVTSVSIISFHTDLCAHWSWRPFWSLHPWESHITLKSRISTFTLQSTVTSECKKMNTMSLHKKTLPSYTVFIYCFLFYVYFNVLKMYLKLTNKQIQPTNACHSSICR